MSMRKLGTHVVLGAIAICAATGATHAAITVDGSLDPAYGSVLSTQTNPSNAQFGYDGSGIDGTGSSSSNDQLSNAYGLIDTANNHLDLFLGGAVNLNDERLILLIDANPTTGVATLAPGVHAGANDVGNVPAFDNSANLKQATMDSGFRPETMIQTQFGGGNIFFWDNLSTGVEYKDDYAADPRSGPITRGVGGSVAGDTSPTLTVADSTANEGTLITSNFGSVNKGFEIQFNLTDLGYVPGSPINISAFIDQQSNNGMSNQILGPTSAYNTASNYYNFDFANTAGNNWPGAQFFTVPAPVPEPASIGLLIVAGAGLLGRRNRSK